MVIDIEEDNGIIKTPIKGLRKEELDRIQKDILKYCEYLKPNYIPLSNQLHIKVQIYY